MKKLILISFLFQSVLVFSQDVPKQKPFTRWKVIEKYLFELPETISNYIGQNLDTYEEFMEKGYTNPDLKLEKSPNRSCSEVCPRSMDILNLTKKNFKQFHKNTFTFLNSVEDFKDTMVKQHGFCWGHASMTNQVKHLAYFDYENKFGLVDAPYTQQWRDYIKEAIVDMMNYKPRILPHLRSIKELSFRFEKELKEAVIEKWATEAVGITNFMNRFDNTNTYTREEIKKFIDELNYRLDHGQSPEIIFNIWGSTTWIHVALVTKVTYNEFDYTYTLKLEDNKQYNNASTEPSTIVIDLKNNRIDYPLGPDYKAPTTKVGRFTLTKTSYYRYNRMLENLVNFCEEKTECKK